MKTAERGGIASGPRTGWGGLRRSVALGFVCAALGFALGTLVRGPGIPPGHASDFVEVRDAGMSFVRPLLECERSREASANGRLEALRRRVEDVVAGAVGEGRASHVSVYFRDLDVGTWFSVNPVDRFKPASLLKVPVIMALLRETEGNPQLLRRPVRFDGEADLTLEQTIKPAEPLLPGRDYPVGELARRMVVHSDNNAARLVLEALPPEAVDRLYADLGVAFSGAPGDAGFLSVDAYASFFRVLYNGTYPGPRSSEAILALLAQRSFAGGLRAGVPAEIPVAAKFGEWQLPGAAPAREQFHDCGIVYHPERPYLLCVMTRGPRFEPLDGVVTEIAREVYAEVDAPELATALVAGLPGPAVHGQ